MALKILLADKIEGLQSQYMGELASAPSTPASGQGVVYVKNDGKIYFKNDAGTEYDLTVDTNTGEANTASNVGAGEGVFKEKSGVDLRFRSLVAGTGITLNGSADEIEIVGSASGANTALSNLTTVQINADLDFDTANTYRVGTQTAPAIEVWSGEHYIRTGGVTKGEWYVSGDDVYLVASLTDADIVLQPNGAGMVRVSNKAIDELADITETTNGQQAMSYVSTYKNAGSFKRFEVQAQCLGNASLTQFVDFHILNVAEIVEGLVIALKTSFTGGFSSLVLDVGTSTAPTKYVSGFDLMQTANATSFVSVSNTFSPELIVGNATLRITFTAVGANVNTQTGGLFDIWLKSALPSEAPIYFTVN